MPRVKDIAWKFVDKLEGGRWCCPYCEKIYHGQVTRVKSHFLEIPNRGIYLCTKVPQHIRELMKWLLDQVWNKEDTAWKFVERLRDDKWRCYHCKEEFLGDTTRVKGHLLRVSYEGISICPKVPDTIRKLMLSLLEEAAEEEGREANGQSSTEPRHLVICQTGITTPSACPQDQVSLHPGNMPLDNLATTQQSNLSNHRLDVAQGNDTENWNPPGCIPEWPSFHWQTGISTSSAWPQHQVSFHLDNMPLDNLGTTQQPDSWNHGLDVARGNETGNEEQNLRGLSSFPNDHVRGDNISMGLRGIPRSDSPIYSSNWSIPYLVENFESHDVIGNIFDETQMDKPHNPTGGSSLQNDSSLDVNSMKRLQDYSQPCGAEVASVRGNTSPTNPGQHPDQLHPRYDKEDGNNIRSFASRTPMDMDPSIASQQTSDSHNIEPIVVDVQVSDAATNAIGSSSSQGKGRSSMELQSRDLPSEAQAGVAEEENREAHRRYTSSPTKDMYEHMKRLLITSREAAHSSNFNQQHAIALNSDQQSQGEFQFDQCSPMPSPVQKSHGESMSCSGEEECYLPNSPYHEERQMNDQQSPAGESSSQRELSRAVGSSNCLQDCNQDPQLQTPMDINPSMASQPASDSHNIEPTATDLQVSEVTTNAIGPSSSQASVPPQRQSVPHQSPNFKTAHQNPTILPSSWGVSPVTCHLPPPLNMAPCIPSSSQSPNNAPPPPPIPPCGTGLIGPSSSRDMNEGAPMASHANMADNFKENGALKRKLEKVYKRVADIWNELEYAASMSIKNQRREVENWLPDAKMFIEDYTQAASKGCLPPHEVKKLKRKSEDLLRRGKFPKGLFVARETKVTKLLVGKMVGVAFRINTKKILNYLVGNKISRLGIYGMGGVGKTTIMKHIHNRLIEKANYDKILWITVSKDLNTEKLQDDIWKALGLGKLQETEVSKRAAKLHDRLMKSGKCTLILDDVWLYFDLKELGIPIRADGFQLVLTTRSFDVCRQMQCQENIKIEPLSQKEAESLFLEELGSKVALSLEIKAVVKSIVEECAGLPLGVITIAKSMRGATKLFEWNDFLVELKESSMRQTDMTEKVLTNLQFSYDRLRNPEVQRCFLSCALYPEDELIDKFELIELFIDQGLIRKFDTREQQYNRGLTILSILENVCLLEDHEEKMKMHDLIRDMALHIMGATSMVKAGKGLTGIPNEEYWTDALEKVSLMENDIREFPLDMSPNCPKLLTLLLNNSLRQVSVISDSFFNKLWGLEVLNLSGCGLTELPNFISDLVNLRALLLRWCWKLHRISCVGKLTALKKLDARGCVSLEEIDGLEKLLKLRYLDLCGTCMERLPKGTLERLLNLQYLSVGAPNEEDVTKLVALETLQCYFGDADDFNKCVRVVEQSKALRYDLTVNNNFFRRGLSDDSPFFNMDRRVFINGWTHAIVSTGGECAGIFISIPQDVQKLTMLNCDGTTNLAGMGPLKCLEELFIESGENLRVLCGGEDEEVIGINDSPTTTPRPPLFSSLRLLKIDQCPELKYLFGYGSKFSLPHLREIDLSYCGEMVGIMATVTSPPPCPNPAFPNLEKIGVEGCDKMKRVVESGLLPHFPNLREIRVDSCENMEEIIGGPPLYMTIPLEYLSVSYCDTFRMLLTLEWLIHLRTLRSISVDNAAEMVEMISRAGQSREGSMVSEAGQSHGGSIMTPVNNTLSSVSLPKLTHLRLEDLPQLQSICEVSVTCDSIEDMTVDKCPELKRIPLQLRLHDDKDLPHILVEDEGKWKTLTWKDHINTQSILQPYLREVERQPCPTAIELCPIGLDLK